MSSAGSWCVLASQRTGGSSRWQFCSTLPPKNEWVVVGGGNVELKRLSNILKEKIKLLLDFSKWLDDKLKNQKDDVSAACNDFLKVLGYVALGFSWLKMTKVSFDNSSKNKNFYEEKINTAKYFFDKILPRIDSHYHSAIAGSESLMKAKFN